MFCLKLLNGDWDLQNLDLHEEDIDIDLDLAYCCLSWPVADNVSGETLQCFGKNLDQHLCRCSELYCQSIQAVRPCSGFKESVQIRTVY